MELQKYFNLEEYVDKIELTDQVLAHLQSTSKSFDEYFKILSQYGKYAIYFWIDSLYKELIASSEIEGDLISLLQMRIVIQKLKYLAKKMAKK